jgi:probable phosphoglycerate mutase
VLGLAQGHADEAVLTRQGRRQAQLLAHRLGGRTFAAVYTSDLRRARETAAIVAKTLGLPTETHADLRERSLGELEGAPVSALFPEATGIAGDQVVDIHARPAGGESLEELYRRAGGFVEWLRHQPLGSDAIVIAHGGTVRMLRAYCAGRPVQDMTWDTVPNGSLWRVQVPSGHAAAGQTPVRAM